MQLVVRHLAGGVVVGGQPAEQHDEWAEGRRYLGLEVLAKSRLAATTTDQTDHEEDA
jgi:putative transposase